VSCIDLARLGACRKAKEESAPEIPAFFRNACFRSTTWAQRAADDIRFEINRLLPAIRAAGDANRSAFGHVGRA
jgi:hypothetical protein